MNQLNILVVGDLHFKITNLPEMKVLCDQIKEKAQTMKPSFIVLLGDTLDRHESIHVSPLTDATKFIYELSRISKVYLLIGNHDLKNNKQFCSEEHPFTGLKYINNITVIDSPLVEEINGMTFSFLPYLPNNRFHEGLQLIPKWKDSTAIFCHQEFKGCKMGSIVSTSDNWDLNNPLIISGHIHNYQEPQSNMIYIGTPIQHGFGDNDKKTISLFTFTYIINEMNHIRIDLNLKKKKIVYLDTTNFYDYMPNVDEYLKIIIRGTQEELNILKKHKNVKLWKELGHNISWKENKEKLSKIEKHKTKTFYDYLYELIDDENCKKVFNEIFN
jgi:DNA repair exonuclease SbcCD nuclease subunit